MFSDMFDGEQDDQFDNGIGSTANKYERRPNNCAELLDMPEKPREGFVGLKNQGATCYLNSLIQSFFMSPEFRNTILTLPLCNDDITQQSDFLDDIEKTTLLLSFQKLFIQMQSGDCRSVSTEELTRSFGWTGIEALQQQDVQEAQRILFDVLNKALTGTQFNLTEHYRGVQITYTTCLDCTYSNQREEAYSDIILQVQGCATLEEALLNYVNPEKLEGNNQYRCDVCEKKVDALRGTKLKTLPRILTMSLNRYTYDVTKHQRVKLIDRFEFPLEVNMGAYLEQDGQECIYDLASIIIHSGTAHGGHYHAYFRDLMNEGDWAGLMAQFWDDKDNQQQKQNNKQNDIDYDELEFPRMATNEELNYNWFDFNDSCVASIPINRLQKQYQGAESAYILVYRQRGQVPTMLKAEQIPKYLTKYVQELNTIRQDERDKYEDAKQYIKINIANADIIDFNTRQLKNDKYESQEHKIRLSSTVGELYTIINQKEYSLLEFVEDYQTKLLHFTRFLNDHEATFQQEDVKHQSTWILIQNQNEIQHLVGKQSIPCKLNLLYQGKPRTIIMMVNQSISDLQEQIQQIYDIPPNYQFLKNLQSDQIISTDKVDGIISELKLGYDTQIMVDKVAIKTTIGTEQQHTEQLVANEGGEIVTIVVQRDDEFGFNKYYIDLNQTLEELQTFILENLGIKDKRRIRRQDNSTLFYKNQLPLKLHDLNFQEGGIRLLVERGEIPDHGQISIKVRSDSQHTQNKSIVQDIVCDPDKHTISDLKNMIAAAFNLDPEVHKLYKTDWKEEPQAVISNETDTVSKAALRENDLVVIGDIGSVQQCELIRFEIYLTRTGFPDDCQYQKDVTFKRESTLQEFKEMLLELLQLQTTIDRLRVRELNKNYFFGTVLRNHNKSLKRFQLTSNKLVIQCLEQVESLADTEMLLVIKERDVQTRTYINQREFVYDTSKGLTIQALKDQIIAVTGIAGQVELSKFQAFEFEWIHFKLPEETQEFQPNEQNKSKGKENKKKSKVQDNVKKAPFLLKEGEFVGYRIGVNVDDDFQTKEDQELRKKMIEARKNKHNNAGGGIKEKGFGVNLGFMNN